MGQFLEFLFTAVGYAVFMAVFCLIALVLIALIAGAVVRVLEFLDSRWGNDGE